MSISISEGIICLSLENLEIIKTNFLHMLSVCLLHDNGFINFHTKIINTIALHKLVVSNMDIQVIVINVHNSLSSRC